jgi:hypothetical protein
MWNLEVPTDVARADFLVELEVADLVAGAGDRFPAVVDEVIGGHAGWAADDDEDGD